MIWPRPHIHMGMVQSTALHNQELLNFIQNLPQKQKPLNLKHTIIYAICNTEIENQLK